ncbi:hypothetical protein FRB98_003595 [Tulasnella sp. 332]|nr:hypothetical protein FRB98_003595 [Tulasnella sp. 332]
MLQGGLEENDTFAGASASNVPMTRPVMHEVSLQKAASYNGASTWEGIKPLSSTALPTKDDDPDTSDKAHDHPFVSLVPEFRRRTWRRQRTTAENSKPSSATGQMTPPVSATHEALSNHRVATTVMIAMPSPAQSSSHPRTQGSRSTATEERPLPEVTLGTCERMLRIDFAA